MILSWRCLVADDTVVRLPCSRWHCRLAAFPYELCLLVTDLFQLYIIPLFFVVSVNTVFLPYLDSASCFPLVQIVLVNNLIQIVLFDILSYSFVLVYLQQSEVSNFYKICQPRVMFHSYTNHSQCDICHFCHKCSVPPDLQFLWTLTSPSNLFLPYCSQVLPSTDTAPCFMLHALHISKAVIVLHFFSSFNQPFCCNICVSSQYNITPILPYLPVTLIPSHAYCDVMCSKCGFVLLS
jgi:hypothetical protein